MGLFQSFFMGGYECADHVNRHGHRLNLLHATRHNELVEHDYSLLLPTPIRTVREGICWSEVEPQPYKYNFTGVHTRILAAQQMGVQQIWDICHFGFPADIYPTHPQFVPRFTALCAAFTGFYLSVTQEQLMVVPINEISFLAWMAGEVRGTAPYAVNCGFDIKYHLCKACIAGINAIRTIAPNSIIITSEPLIHIHATNSNDVGVAEEHSNYQYQAMDMLMGTMCPELGGAINMVDIVGVNYYYSCQWYLNGETLPWPCNNNLRRPLHLLLLQTYQRYNKPLLLTETGHFGEGRAAWLEEVTAQCNMAKVQGVPLQGICIYPLLNRPDWDDVHHMHTSGLWDYEDTEQLNRVINTEYLEMLARVSTNHYSHKVNLPLPVTV